jgi:hypothetical protein
MGDLPDWQTRISTGDDDIVFTGSIAHGGGIVAVGDVSAYNSVQVFLKRTTNNGQLNLGAVWQNVGSLVITTDTLLAYPSALAVTWPSMTMPVRAPFLQLVNQGADDLTITVLASKRTVAGLIGVGYNDRTSYVNTSAAMVAGTFYPIGSNPITVSQGLHQMELTISNVAVTGGVFLQTAPGGASADTMLIADSGEGVNDGTVRTLSKQVILPASQCQVAFLCRAAGTAIVVVSFQALGH